MRTFGFPTFDILPDPVTHQRRPRHELLGKSSEVRGPHIPVDTLSRNVTAITEEIPDGFKMEAPTGQQHLSLKVRWDPRNETQLVVSNSDTNPETGKGWGDTTSDSRPGQREHVVECSVPLRNWDWNLSGGTSIQTDSFQGCEVTLSAADHDSVSVHRRGPGYQVIVGGQEYMVVDKLVACPPPSNSAL